MRLQPQPPPGGNILGTSSGGGHLPGCILLGVSLMEGHPPVGLLQGHSPRGWVDFLQEGHSSGRTSFRRTLFGKRDILEEGAFQGVGILLAENLPGEASSGGILSWGAFWGVILWDECPPQTSLQGVPLEWQYSRGHPGKGIFQGGAFSGRRPSGEIL